MQLKLGFSVERKCYIYNESITLSPSLSIYIYTVAGREGGGRVRCGGCEKMLHPLPLFRTVSDLCKIFLEKILKCLSQMPFEIHPTSSCHFFLSDLSLWWQYKEILNCKHNHKFKHTKAASTKPLGWIKFIFSNPPPLFWYRHTTAYICIYSITQVRYL